jgi:hypothetical protein
VCSCKNVTSAAVGCRPLTYCYYIKVQTVEDDDVRRGMTTPWQVSRSWKYTYCTYVGVIHMLSSTFFYICILRSTNHKKNTKRKKGVIDDDSTSVC